MTISNIKLAELLCTKFCHDIIGPVGAVNNGIDFLMEEIGNLQSQAADLISNSSRESIARIQFFRQTFGSKGADSSVSLSETKQLTETYFSQSKIKLVWDDQYTDNGPHQISSVDRKILLNLFLVAASALIKGGDLVFEISDSGKSITAKSEVLKLDTQTAEIFNEGFDEAKLDARNIQAYFTKLLAEEAGKKIKLETGSKEISFKLVR